MFVVVKLKEFLSCLRFSKCFSSGVMVWNLDSWALKVSFTWKSILWNLTVLYFQLNMISGFPYTLPLALCAGLIIWSYGNNFSILIRLNFCTSANLEDEKQILQTKVSVLMQTIWIPALSEVRSLSLSLCKCVSRLWSRDVALALAMF